MRERRLISLISGKGKSPEQLKAEVVAAYQKWQAAPAQHGPESDGPESS